MLVINKIWGEEHVLMLDETFMMKKLILRPGMHSSLHYHIKKNETFDIISGYGFILLNDVLYNARPGSHFVVNAGDVHKIYAKTTLVILEKSTSEFEDVVRL